VSQSDREVVRAHHFVELDPKFEAELLKLVVGCEARAAARERDGARQMQCARQDRAREKQRRPLVRQSIRSNPAWREARVARTVGPSEGLEEQVSRDPDRRHGCLSRGDGDFKVSH
jgi:hypothetical protein